MGYFGSRIHPSPGTLIRWCFWVPRGCFGCRIEASHLAAVRWWPMVLFGLLNPSVTRDTLRWWFLSPEGLFRLSNRGVTPGSSSLMTQGAVWAVESNRHPWHQFVDDLWVPRGLFGMSNRGVTLGSSSLLAQGVVWAVASIRHPSHQFVDDFWVPRGSFGCRIQSSHMTAVRWWPKGLFGLLHPSVTRDTSSLMISESLGALSTVESTRHPWQQFVDD
jgi:hypothetical protein